jgi:NadR type nicotinamide-nucleotide adenylyltransferase
VLVLPDPEPTGDDDAVSAAHAAHFRAHYAGERVTHVFSSEDYGARFAAYLGAEHVLVDRDRLAVPVSGTAIRADPYAHRHFLAPIVYRDLVRRVCFIGAESTGKTTLAAALADRHGTVWMPEYGRELYERKRRRLVFDDLLAIAEEHRRREDALALQARHFLFCDTNAVTTVFWSRFYFDRVDPALARLAEEVAGDYDYVLCRNDFPYVQDGWRETGGSREWYAHQEEIRADLERRGLRYVEVGGPLDARIEAVSRWLEGASASSAFRSSGRVVIATPLPSSTRGHSSRGRSR